MAVSSDMLWALTRGAADHVVQNAAEQAGVRLARGRHEVAIRASETNDGLEIRIELPRQLYVIGIPGRELECASGGGTGLLYDMIVRSIQVGAARLRAGTVLHMLDRQRPIDFTGHDGGEDQAAARLLEEATRLLERSARRRGRPVPSRAAAAAVAMDAALEGSPERALEVLRIGKVSR